MIQEIQYNISHRSQETFGQEGIEGIFQDPTATRAVFLRGRSTYRGMQMQIFPEKPVHEPVTLRKYNYYSVLSIQ